MHLCDQDFTCKMCKRMAQIERQKEMLPANEDPVKQRKKKH